MLDIKTHHLPNGFRIVVIDLPNFHSVTNFLAIRSGSRYEELANSGVAHFLEHMVFKGTQKYPDTLAIARAIEGIGGYFNAWTANDHTTYWNTVPASQLETGLDMCFELGFNALLRPADIERERGVITEEIRMIQDDPARHVDDLSGPLLYPDHPLGRSVIGTEDTIKKMTHQQFIDYRAAHYTPSQSLFIVIGRVSDHDVVSLVKERVGHLKAQPVSQPNLFQGHSQTAVKLQTKPTDQTHFILGVSAEMLGLNHDQLAVAEVLNAILGQGMSSRLFLNVREKQGLAYAIHSSISPFEETGVLSIYGGVNTKKIDQALLAIEQEIEQLQQDAVSPAELQKAQALLVGSYDLSSDRPIDLARWYGVGVLLGQDKTFDQAKAEVKAVTAQQVQTLAQQLLAKDRQTLTVIGPYPDDQRFRTFLDLSPAK